MCSSDLILNSNDSLIVQLLKSTSQSTVKKSISKAFSDIANSKTSENNAINIIQSYYENYAKKYKIDSDKASNLKKKNQK